MILVTEAETAQTIMKWLSEPLMHEGEDRTEAEATVLELALNLIRCAAAAVGAVCGAEG